MCASKVNNSSTWSEQFIGLGEDIRAEVLFYIISAAGRENGLLFYLNGGFRRAFRKDIAGIHLPGHHKFKNKSTLIELHRRGLYDQFPEFLFHRSKSSKHFKSIEDLKAEHEYQEHIAFSARKFFWPLDDQLTKIKAHVLAFELSMGMSSRSASGKGHLRRFWNIPSLFDDVQAQMITRMIPLAREIASRLAWIEEAISLIMKLPVKVIKELRVFTRPGRDSILVLGNSQVGIEGVLGQSFLDERYCITFAIGPVDMRVANEFAPQGRRLKQMHYLIDQLVPADMDSHIEIVPKADFSFTLFEDDGLCSILGVSSILSHSR